MEYILVAVNSARQIFLSHVIQKKNAAEQERRSSTKLSGDNISVAVNGQLEEWTEEDVTNGNGFKEERVISPLKSLYGGQITFSTQLIKPDVFCGLVHFFAVLMHQFKVL